jgi:hypothetical protein
MLWGVGGSKISGVKPKNKGFTLFLDEKHRDIVRTVAALKYHSGAQ